MMTFDENGVSPWVQGKRKNSVTPLEPGRDPRSTLIADAVTLHRNWTDLS